MDESACNHVVDVLMPLIPLTSTSANVGSDALSEVPPAIADDDGESACSMVDDVPMSPVDPPWPPLQLPPLQTSPRKCQLFVMH